MFIRHIKTNNHSCSHSHQGTFWGGNWSTWRNSMHSHCFEMLVILNTTFVVYSEAKQKILSQSKDFFLFFFFVSARKPFQCRYCPYSASQKGNLKTHVLCVHRKPFDNSLYPDRRLRRSHAPQAPSRSSLSVTGDNRESGRDQIGATPLCGTWCRHSNCRYRQFWLLF